MGGIVRACFWKFDTSRTASSTGAEKGAAAFLALQAKSQFMQGAKRFRAGFASVLADKFHAAEDRTTARRLPPTQAPCGYGGDESIITYS
jgi:hypothetical protein